MTQICKKGHFPTNDDQILHSIFCQFVRKNNKICYLGSLI